MSSAERAQILLDKKADKRRKKAEAASQAVVPAVRAETVPTPVSEITPTPGMSQPQPTVSASDRAQKLLERKKQKADAQAAAEAASQLDNGTLLVL